MSIRSRLASLCYPDPTYPARMVLYAILVASALIACCSGGCGSSSTQTAGSARYRVTERETAPYDPPCGPPSPDGLTITKERTYEGDVEGGTLRASGKDVTGDFKGTLPELIFPEGGGTRGGNTSSSVEILGGFSILPVLFGLAGAISVVVGVYFVRLFQIANAVTAFLAGGVFILIAFYPGLVVLAVLAILGLLFLFGVSGRRHDQWKELSRAAVAALHDDAQVANPRELLKRAADRPSDIRLFDEVIRRDSL
jgi:hypothetical protein